MPVFVALLRGINVGGHARVAMPALREWLEALGYEHVRTYLQSGNVVFSTSERSASRISKSISDAIEKELDLTVPVLIRSSDEMERVLSGNPFINDKREAAHLHVTFLAEKPSADRASAFRAPEGQTDELVLIDQEVYLHCPGGYGKTKLNNTFIERRLAVTATTRNWKSVTRLAEMTRA